MWQCSLTTVIYLCLSLADISVAVAESDGGQCNAVTVFQHTLPPGLRGDGGCRNKLSDNVCNTNTPAGPSFLVDGSMTTLFDVDGSEDSVTTAFALSNINPPSIARVEVSLLTCPQSENTNVILYSSLNFNSGPFTPLVNAAGVPCSTAQNVTLSLQPPVVGSGFYLLEFTNAAMNVAEVQFMLCSTSPPPVTPANLPPFLATPTTSPPPVLATPTTSSQPILPMPSPSFLATNSVLQTSHSRSCTVNPGGHKNMCGTTSSSDSNNAIIGGAVGGLLAGVLFIVLITGVVVNRRRREKAAIHDHEYIDPSHAQRSQVIPTSLNVAYVSSVEIQGVCNPAFENTISTRANTAYASQLERQL